MTGTKTRSSSRHERSPAAAANPVGSPWPWLAALAALFVFALGWRLAYLGRLAASPYAESLTEDAAIYWEWSGFLLRSGVMGAEPYFFGPLYPYVVAALRLVIGNSIPWLLVVQAVWGSVAVVLLADAVRRMTRPAVGVVAGLLVAGHGMAVFFDGLVLMESLLFFLETLLMWCVARTGREDLRLRALVVIGVLIGAVAIGRPAHVLLMIPALALLVPWRTTSQRTALLRGAALVGGALLLVLPVTFRNWRVSGEWIPITYSGGFNLYVGNNPRATGGWGQITGTSRRHVISGEGGGETVDGREYLRTTAGLEFTASESSQYWADKALAFMRDEPIHALRLTARKLGMLWNRREYPQIENAEAYRRAAGPLGFPLIGSFVVLGVLALGGVWFAWGQGRPGRYALAYVVAITIGTVPFFVTDRYRLHLVPGVVLLAGLCLERLWLAWRSPGLPRRKWLGTVALGAVVVNLPAPQLSKERLEWSIAADIASRWLEKGHPDRALPYLQQAVEGEAREARPGARTGTTRSERAQLHYDYGRTLRALNRDREAVRWFELAAREAPEMVEINRMLAEAYAAAGEAARSDSVRGRISSLVGGAGMASYRAGMQAAQAGQMVEAAAYFQKATQEDPHLYGAWGALIRAHVQLGSQAGAERALEDARKAGLPAAPYWAHQALVLAAWGRPNEAEEALARVPADAIVADRDISQVVQVTRGLIARWRR